MQKKLWILLIWQGKNWQNRSPKVSRLRNCIALIAPMMTIANGIPTLSSNLQKFGEFIMNYIK